MVFLSADDQLERMEKYHKEKLNEIYSYCTKLVKCGDGNNIVMDRTGVYITAKKFMSLFKTGTLETSIFDYRGGLRYLRDIDLPKLFVFASGDNFLLHDNNFYVRSVSHNISKSSVVFIKSTDHSLRDRLPAVLEEITAFVKNTI